MDIAKRHNLTVVEDAAQAIDSFYNGKPLGGIGHLGCFSFHETKNIQCGEGGMLVINDERFSQRAEIIWEKGTNRAEFFRGEVNKYGWVDIGSSFLPSEITAAFLYAQLENLGDIQNRRKCLWDLYYAGLKPLESDRSFNLSFIPGFATNNYHMFYFVCESFSMRSKLISLLKENGILAVFHYLSLHSSEFYSSKHDSRKLNNCNRFTNGLIRLPFFYELSETDINYILSVIISFLTINNH